MLRWCSTPSPTQVPLMRTRHGLPGRIISTTAPRTNPMSASRFAAVSAALMDTTAAASPVFKLDSRSWTAPFSIVKHNPGGKVKPYTAERPTLQAPRILYPPLGRGVHLKGEAVVRVACIRQILAITRGAGEGVNPRTFPKCG